MATSNGTPCVAAAVDDAEVGPPTFGLILLTVYGSSVLLVLLFYCVEDAPWHYSRRVESAYLSTVLLLIYSASVWLAMPVDDVFESIAHPFSDCNLFFVSCLPDNSQQSLLRLTLRALLAIRHIMMLIITIYIVERFVKPRSTPAFYDEAGGQRVKREQDLRGFVSQQPVVVRLARELNETIDEIKDLTRVPSLLPSAPQSQSLVMLALLMLADIAVALPHISATVFWVAKCMQVCLWLYICGQLAAGWCKYGSFVDRATLLLGQVIEAENKEALKYLLATVNVGSLLEISTDMLGLLTRDALEKGLLDCPEKAMCIYSLQNIGLPRSRRRQEAVQRLLLRTRCEELTELKQLLDGTGNYHNLYKLVYYDISSDAIRESILDHLKSQARLVRERPGRTAGIKVCSDIDDTLYSSGGRFPAGCDRTYPKGVVYPGCLSLFCVLDKAWQPGAPSSNLAFLSARPHVYKSWAEKKSYNLFKELVEEESMHSIPTMIPGALGLGLWAMATYPCVKNLAWRRVGEFKYQTYLKFARLYLEYDFVFCGDDGQGDLWAGQRMVLNRKSDRVLDEAVSEDRSERSEDADDDSSSHERPGGSKFLGASAAEQQSSRLGLASLGSGGALEARAAERAVSSSSSIASAQGDCTQVSTGGRSWNTATCAGGRMRGVLIHEVCDRSKHVPLAWGPADTADEDEREYLASHKLFFHRTYVGAALALHQCDPSLVSLEDLETVAKDAMKELEEVRLMYPEMAGKWDPAEQDLKKDLQATEEVLLEAGRSALRPLRTATQVIASSELGDIWDSVRAAGCRRR